MKKIHSNNWCSCIVVCTATNLTLIYMYVTYFFIYRPIFGSSTMTVSFTLPSTSSRLLVLWQTILQDCKIILMAAMSLESLWTLPLEVKGVSWLKKSDRWVCYCWGQTETTDDGALVIAEFPFSFYKTRLVRCHFFSETFHNTCLVCIHWRAKSSFHNLHTMSLQSIRY